MKPIQSPAIEYPSFTAGGKTFHLCWGPAGRYQLQRFGFWGVDADGKPTQKAIPVLAWAAAGAGTVDRDGLWTSAEFESPFALAKLLSGDEEGRMGDAVVAMLKNMMPEAKLTLVENPAQTPIEGAA
jgi:hypothetical protein